MKNKILSVIAAFIVFLCSVMQAHSGLDEQYYGMPMYFEILSLIFSSVSFVTLSLLTNARSGCLYNNENIVRLTRLKSRSAAMKIEIIKTAVITILYNSVQTAIISLFNFIFYGSVDFKKTYIYLLYGIIVSFCLMLFQFNIELHLTKNFAFLIISLSYIVFNILGSFAYAKYLDGTADSKLMMYFLKFNLINYLSFTRIEIISKNIFIPLIVIFLIDIILIILSFVFIHKKDILQKE